MKYVILIVLALIIILLVYSYLRVKYIERNIDFSISISEIGIKEGKLLDALNAGEVKFNSTFVLNIINKSNLSLTLKKLRVILITDSDNLSIISRDIQKVKIEPHQTNPVDIPSDIIIKSGAIGEALSLIKGEKISINYKVLAKVGIFPLFYEGTLEI